MPCWGTSSSNGKTKTERVASSSRSDSLQRVLLDGVSPDGDEVFDPNANGPQDGRSPEKVATSSSYHAQLMSSSTSEHEEERAPFLGEDDESERGRLSWPSCSASPPKGSRSSNAGGQRGGSPFADHRAVSSSSPARYAPVSEGIHSTPPPQAGGPHQHVGGGSPPRSEVEVVSTKAALAEEGSTAPLVEKSAGRTVYSLQLILACLFQLPMGMIWTTMGLIVLPYEAEKFYPEKHSALLSLLVTIAGTSQLTAPMIGRLSDKHQSVYGRRRPFIVIGSITFTLGIIGLSYSSEQDLISSYAGSLFLSQVRGPVVKQYPEDLQHAGA